MSSPTPSLSPGAWLALSRWTGCCVRSLLSPSFTAGTRAERRSQKMAPASGLGGGHAPLPSMSPGAWLARSSWTECCSRGLWWGEDRNEGSMRQTVLQQENVTSFNFFSSLRWFTAHPFSPWVWQAGGGGRKCSVGRRKESLETFQAPTHLNSPSPPQPIYMHLE